MRRSNEIHAVRCDHARGDDLAYLHVVDVMQHDGAVDLGRLVRAAPFREIRLDGFDEDLDRCSDAFLGPLRGQLLDQIGDPLHASIDVLVESVADDVAEGRAEHQAPEVDGMVVVHDVGAAAVGHIVTARVVTTDGVDLVATVAGAGAR